MPAHVRCFLLGSALALTACGGLSDADVVRLVEAYNDRVTEAYRTADPKLVEGVAGPEEARKIAGLIGVKQDQGIVLDSRLREFEVRSIERPANGDVVVATDEEWYYFDRRIGSGDRVGEDSTDHYRVHYVLRRLEPGWRVVEIRFAEPPEVGRTLTPDHASVSVMHGLAPSTAEGEEP